MTRMRTTGRAAMLAAMLAAPALGGIITTQGTSAPTYGTTLDFDEPGGPTGAGIPTDAWLASHGVASLDAGDGGGADVDLWNTIPGLGHVGSGYAMLGNFGVFLATVDDMTEMSAQVWDPSGGPPFGGMAVSVWNDGAEISFTIVTPAWGGVGDEWIDITTDGGSVFDEVRFVGFGFDPSTFADNMSWNVVPEPTSLALLGLAGLAILRRRRN